MTLKTPIVPATIEEKMSRKGIYDLLTEILKQGKDHGTFMYHFKVIPSPKRFVSFALPEGTKPGHQTEVSCGHLTHEFFYSLKQEDLKAILANLLPEANEVEMKFVGAPELSKPEIKRISLFD